MSEVLLVNWKQVAIHIHLKSNVSIQMEMSCYISLNKVQLRMVGIFIDDRLVLVYG